MSKYVAYVGSYTYIGNSQGITILDMDVDKGTMKVRREEKVHSVPFLEASPDHKYLYALCDEGVATFLIDKDGDLSIYDIAPTYGMRGRFLDIDPTGRYIAVAGYHDGKTTVLKIREDGAVGEITGSIYDRGMGSIAERDSQPHVSCVRFTRDSKYLCSIDAGLDNIQVFRLDNETGAISLATIIHCDVQSGPNRMVFSQDGRFLYVLCQISNTVVVYSYEEKNGEPVFRRIQTLSTVVGKRSASSSLTAAMHIDMSYDDKYLLYTSVGDNNLGMYRRDQDTGLLTHMFSLPVSGQYPKDFILFPDGKHIAVVNYEEETLTFFAIDYDKGLIIMNSSPIHIDQPCCGMMIETPEK